MLHASGPDTKFDFIIGLVQLQGYSLQTYSKDPLNRRIPAPADIFEGLNLKRHMTTQVEQRFQCGNTFSTSLMTDARHQG